MGGACKPLLRVGGVTLLERQLAALRPLVDEVIVLANDDAAFARYGLRVVPDLRPGHGPLAGLEAALVAPPADHVLLVAGDMPSLVPRALALLLDAATDR